MAERIKYIRGMLDAMNTIANNFAKMDSTEQAMSLYRAVRQSAQEQGFRKEITAAVNGIGMIYLMQSRLDSALITFQQALITLDTSNHRMGITLHNNIGTVFLKRTLFDSAIAEFILSLRIAERMNAEDMQVPILGNIGNVYGDFKKYDKALEFNLRAVKIAERLRNERFLAVLYSNIAGDYAGKQEYEAALEYLRKAVMIKEKLQMKSSLAYSYGVIADIYTLTKKPSLAIEPLQKAIKIEEELGQTQQFIESYAKITLAYFHLKDFKQAVHYGKKAFDLADTIPDFRFEKRMASEYLGYAYEGLGNYKEALYYQRVYTALQDSIYNQESASKIAEIQTKYDTELKDKEILQQQLTISTQNASLQQRNFFIIGMVSLVAVLGLLINRFRLKRRADAEIQRKNEEIAVLERTQALERERRRISQDIHDEVGSGLTKILMLSQNAADTTQPNKEISNTAQGVIDGMQEIIWSINPKNDTLQSLIAFIRSYGREFVHAAGMNIVVEAPEGLAATPLRTDVRRNVFLAVKEALNNAVKYSAATEIRIGLEVQPSAYSFTIADNGKGFVPDGESLPTVRGGNGLKNMRFRIEEIGGNFRLDSAPNEGTRIVLNIPR
ncbi:MAG: tetratricopeptide repeat protein [Candidatus Kapaibacteriota bacterium]